MYGSKQDGQDNYIKSHLATGTKHDAKTPEVASSATIGLALEALHCCQRATVT